MSSRLFVKVPRPGATNEFFRSSSQTGSCYYCAVMTLENGRPGSKS